MAKGVVKWFSSEKKFGFIKTNETEQDIFVHLNDVEQPLVEDQHVEFEIYVGSQGPKARNVRVVPIFEENDD